MSLQQLQETMLDNSQLNSWFSHVAAVFYCKVDACFVNCVCMGRMPGRPLNRGACLKTCIVRIHVLEPLFHAVKRDVVGSAS